MALALKGVRRSPEARVSDGQSGLCLCLGSEVWCWGMFVPEPSLGDPVYYHRRHPGEH